MTPSAHTYSGWIRKGLAVLAAMCSVAAISQIDSHTLASALPPEWIHSLVTLDEIEGPNRAPDLIKPADTPAWRAFKEQLARDDELWYFTSAPETFRRGAGRMGYVILRNGKQIAHFIAIMN